MSLYRNILVPTDFSSRCAGAAQRARNLSALSDGNITLLHVIDYLPPGYAAVELPRELVSKEFMVEKAKAHLDEWASENGLDDCEKIVEAGHPKRSVVEYAERTNADVVVLAPKYRVEARTSVRIRDQYGFPVR